MQLNNYLQELPDFNKLESGQKTKYQTIMEKVDFLTEDRLLLHNRVTKKLIQEDRARFCKMFIAAIDAQDSEAIFEFGRAIERLKTHTAAADRYRSEILKLRRVAELTNTSLSVREVAQMIEWKQSDSADGFSTLRKLCKELKYPLARSR